MALQLIEESRRPLDSELPQDWAGSGLEDDVLVPFSITIGSESTVHLNAGLPDYWSLWVNGDARRQPGE
jgi:hypothetical protein